jgi:hypothetical protein
MKDIEKVLTQLEGLARKWQGEGPAGKEDSAVRQAHSRPVVAALRS